MNEHVEIALRKRGKPLAVRRQLPAGSIELAEKEPVERRLSIGFGPDDDMTAYRMRRVRLLRGWSPEEFRLKVAVEQGVIVLRGDDPESLPEGRYYVDVGIEDTKVRPQSTRAAVSHDGFARVELNIELDERDVSVDLSGADAAIARVIGASTLDEMAGDVWLNDPDVAATRKACLLNLAASLRVRPTKTKSLISNVRRIFVANRDRVYAECDPALVSILEELALDPKKPFYREGRPTADIHLRLLQAIPVDEQGRFSRDRLISFRGEGSPSLQAVVAVPDAGFPKMYAEFDLDLGNALQDVVGFVVHMGELLDGTPTNHLDLRAKLASRKNAARDFVYYRIVG